MIMWGSNRLPIPPFFDRTRSSNRYTTGVSWCYPRQRLKYRPIVQVLGNERALEPNQRLDLINISAVSHPCRMLPELTPGRSSYRPRTEQNLGNMDIYSLHPTSQRGTIPSSLPQRLMEHIPRTTPQYKRPCNDLSRLCVIQQGQRQALSIPSRHHMMNEMPYLHPSESELHTRPQDIPTAKVSSQIPRHAHYNTAPTFPPAGREAPISNSSITRVSKIRHPRGPRGPNSQHQARLVCGLQATPSMLGSSRRPSLDYRHQSHFPMSPASNPSLSFRTMARNTSPPTRMDLIVPCSKVFLFDFVQVESKLYFWSSFKISRGLSGCLWLGTLRLVLYSESSTMNRKTINLHDSRRRVLVGAAVHRLAESPPNSPTQRRCPLCPQIFEGMSYLQRHISLIHSRHPQRRLSYFTWSSLRRLVLQCIYIDICWYVHTISFPPHTGAG